MQREKFWNDFILCVLPTNTNLHLLLFKARRLTKKNTRLFDVDRQFSWASRVAASFAEVVSSANNVKKKWSLIATATSKQDHLKWLMHYETGLSILTPTLILITSYHFFSTTEDLTNNQLYIWML